MPKLNDQSSAYTAPTRTHHSFVTQAALAGANQADVQQFVGHKKFVYDGLLYALN
ncbi:hypothetical protein [Listeria aquatica]|uniref:hypothetical protein n=1 Tax=Listeria aquatica TaxID=1494960 RepID=UPI0004BB4288|nr:hypothetical protein [Listeria aquatica]